MLFFLIFSGGISLCILFSLIFFNCCFLHQLLNMCPLYFFCIFMISPSEGILILVSFCLLIFLFVFCSIRYHYTIIILIEFSLLIFASLVYSRCSNFLFWSNILSRHLIHYFICFRDCVRCWLWGNLRFVDFVKYIHVMDGILRWIVYHWGVNLIILCKS